MTAIEKAGYTKEIKIAMDVASSEFLTPEGQYNLDFKSDAKPSPEDLLSGAALGQMYQDLCQEFPIVSIEDPFDQDDWTGYSAFQASMGSEIQIVGDDLLCSNPTRIAEAIEKKACNALLLKVYVVLPLNPNPST